MTLTGPHRSFDSLLSKAQGQLALVGPMPTDLPDRFEGLVACVDGGLRHLGHPALAAVQSAGLLLWIGDGDSSPGPLPQGLPCFRLPVDKDVSDLGALLGRLPGGITQLTLWGFLGGRMAQQWANWGELYRWALNHPGLATATFEGGLELRLFGAGQWDIPLEGPFSAMVMEPTKSQIQGDCRYPLPPGSTLLPLSSHGMSNEGHGWVSFQTDRPFFLFTGHFA